MNNGRIVYEVFVKVGEGFSRPHLMVQSLLADVPDVTRQRHLEFSKFKPCKLASAKVFMGVPDSSDSNLYMPGRSGKVGGVDAFLEIESLQQGPWKVFQGVHLPELRNDGKNTWLAYFADEGNALEVLGPFSKSLGTVCYADVIPVGPLVPIEMTKTTGIRQKLLEARAGIVRRLDHRCENTEINAVLHAGNYISTEHPEEYFSMPAIVGRFD